MDTESLIRTLSLDARSRAWPLAAAWRLALVPAALTAALVFFAALGPRPDIADAAHTARFLFKFVFTLALAASAFTLADRLSRPGARIGRAGLRLLAAPLFMAGAVLLELLATPSAEWLARLVGSNNLFCLLFIPLIGAGPLGIFLAVLRHGAPTRPRLAGAVCGLLAGGLAATFYALHCPDDSPLFVAVWYTIATALLTAAGAVLAPRVARW